MRLLIEAHHPAHIHFFKNPIRIWQERGHAVLLIGRDRDVMRQLLDAYDFIPNEIVSGERRRNRFPMREMLARQAAVARAILRFRPTHVLSLMGSYTQAARLFGVPNIVFTDSEFQSFNHRIAHPFASHIYTPRCFYKPLGSKQHQYAGYHELAFLHPKRFTARREVLDQLAINGGPEYEQASLTAARRPPAPGDYVVIRTSAWNTLHDIGQSGLGGSLNELMREVLAKYSVYLVPEGQGRGLGHALYTELLRRVDGDGIHVCLAVIAQPNPASEALHRRLGFAPCGTLREVGRKFDRWVDTAVWQRFPDPTPAPA